MLVLVTPLVFSPSTAFPFIVGKAIWSRILIETVFSMWVILALRRPEYRPASSWLVRLVGLFLLANLLAALFGVSFQRSFWSNFERMQGVFDQAHWFLLLVVAISVVKGLRQWRAVFIWNLIIALFIGLLGLAQRHGVEIPLFSYLGQESRVFSTLGNATFLGAYMMIACKDSLTSD